MENADLALAGDEDSDRAARDQVESVARLALPENDVAGLERLRLQKRREPGECDTVEAGEAVAYALWNLEDRGPMMIEPGWKVYRGMIVGEHTRGNDLEVNVLKGKKLTNIRTHSKDEAVRLTPPILMTLEKALAYIADDELVEVTPKSIRLRKKLLDPNERKKEERRKEVEQV